MIDETRDAIQDGIPAVMMAPFVVAVTEAQ